MKSNLLLISLILLLYCSSFLMAETYTKPRVIVLTDIENEPDDAMSMVRFLVYSNMWEKK